VAVEKGSTANDVIAASRALAKDADARGGARALDSTKALVSSRHALVRDR
jgi:hypothetical protein